MQNYFLDIRSSERKTRDFFCIIYAISDTLLYFAVHGAS
jgi:hypothetical protein